MIAEVLSVADWEEYKFNIPVSGAPGAEAFELKAVSHIAHLKDARRILEDGVLRAGLVNDQSLLDTTRTRVTFFSANAWHNGSIYGNVEWRFDWEQLVSKRKIFWVEKRTGNRFPAYRFLLSDRDPKLFPGLIPYDPKVDVGPLREQGGNWYVNRKDVVSEFLVDGDLEIDNCTEFDFVHHHPDYCRTTGCRDKNTKLHDARAQTIAFVLGSEVRSLDGILQRKAVYRDDKRLADAVGDGLGHLYMRITLSTKTKPTGTINDARTAVALVRGALALWGTGQIARAKDIVRNLESDEVLVKAIETIVEEHFEIKDWCLLEG